VNIQGAKATDDPETIANLIWETDPEMCQFVFEDRQNWCRHCEIEWLAAIGLHTSRCAKVVKQKGQVVGLLIAFPQWEMTARYAATVARYEYDIGQRMKTVGWLFPVLPENSLYVFNLAVSQSLRGQGIGRFLLSSAEEQAQQAGLNAVHLDVPVTSSAVNFYERMGYAKLIKTDLIDPATNIPPHLRMYKPISSRP
jgi:ribosomal protein S18 acetylase RimI-like enzyme